MGCTPQKLNGFTAAVETSASLAPIMARTLISIVIPCYNAARYVGDAIRSALAQTYRPVEVVVVDDGSTDASLNVIRSFGSDIRYTTGPNRGAPAARNSGVELARGELIQFLDADDLLNPAKLETQTRVLHECPGHLVFSDGELVAPDTGRRLCLYARDRQIQDPVIYMLEGGLPTPAPLHRREVLLAAGGFRQHLRCSQERDLHLRIACSGVSFQCVGQVLYTARKLPGSISSSHRKILETHRSIFCDAYEQLTQSGQLSEPRAAAFAAAVARDARWLLRYGLPRQAGDYFALARKLHAGGGIKDTYRPATRALRRLLGPAATERLVMWKRNWGGMGA